MLAALGFDGGFFNVEFFIPDDGPARAIIEVNARISSQFWPLVQAVDGQSTYEALFRLACGDDPAWETGPAGVAISYCLRVFEDAHVRRSRPGGRPRAARPAGPSPLPAGAKRRPELPALHLRRVR